ncbi:unnamed protein product [Moneuplotes crassus]|uniref:UDENN domain-containing protein n=1 Tax=Euplotes crassus TaxID=5936 RepID=A0AAD1XM44_EUPCR|nr:unnamed protein product [Moneuplotes crassus]
MSAISGKEENKLGKNQVRPELSSNRSLKYLEEENTVLKKQYQTMMIKNIRLEEDLKAKTSELQYCKALLQNLMKDKENQDSNENKGVHETPKSARISDAEEKNAPRKSIKHVSFADDFPNSNMNEREEQRVVHKSVNLSRHSCLKASGRRSQQESRHTNVTFQEKEREVSDYNSEEYHKDSDVPYIRRSELENLNSSLDETHDLEVTFSDKEDSGNEEGVNLDSSSDEEEERDKMTTPIKEAKNELKDTQEIGDVSDILFETMENNDEETFEVHQEEIKETPQIIGSKKKSLASMFDLRREKSSNSDISPLKKIMGGVPGPRGGTLAQKSFYQPQESVDYITTLQKSINNKNVMLLSPRFEGTPYLENSIKKGRKYYKDELDGANISANKSKMRINPLDLDQLDYSASKNLNAEYNKSISTMLNGDTSVQPEFEESKYAFGDDLNETGNILADTSELLDMKIPQINKTKINDMGNYNAKYHSFFEEFYIIGVDSLTLGSLNQPEIVLRPSLLKNYPNKPEHKERHGVIKDFCFPVGINVEEIDLSSPRQEQKLNEILFSKPIVVENCFLFTINANDYEKGIIYQDEYLNCLAVIVDEVMKTDHDSTIMSGGAEQDKLYMVQKAYCLMFRGHHFRFQYQILSSLIKIIKHERTLNVQNDIIDLFKDENIFKDYEYLLSPMFSMISTPIFTDEMKNFLNKILDLVPSDYLPEEMIKVNCPLNLSTITYLFPQNELHLAIKWHGPFFFSKIDFGKFFYLFRAILLERSVVFVSEDKNFLSSIINGYRTLLKPFKWCHIFISILPKLLIDYMCAPQPMLLGISNREGFLEELEEDACDEKIWVELDPKDGEFIQIHDSQTIPGCSLGGLDTQLREIWCKIDQLNTCDFRQSTYQINDEEVKLCKDIAESIEDAIDKKILYWVRKFKKHSSAQSFANADQEKEYTDCQKTIIERADVVDKEFLEQFVETQMFAYYFDCC